MALPFPRLSDHHQIASPTNRRRHNLLHPKIFSNSKACTASLEVRLHTLSFALPIARFCGQSSARFQAETVPHEVVLSQVFVSAFDRSSLLRQVKHSALISCKLFVSGIVMQLSDRLCCGWVAFAGVRFPKVSADAIRKWLTDQRTKELLKIATDHADYQEYKSHLLVFNNE